MPVAKPPQLQRSCQELWKPEYCDCHPHILATEPRPAAGELPGDSWLKGHSCSLRPQLSHASRALGGRPKAGASCGLHHLMGTSASPDSCPWGASPRTDISFLVSMAGGGTQLHFICSSRMAKESWILALSAAAGPPTAHSVWELWQACLPHHAAFLQARRPLRGQDNG